MGLYRTTILSGETDPNKLHDLKRGLDARGVYTDADVENLVSLFLQAAPRDQIDPILDACSARYEELSEDVQIAFKGAAKAFVRTYAFLGAILRYAVPEWEKLSTFLTLLIRKLPSPRATKRPSICSKRSTWTATGWRSRRPWRSPWQTPMRRSSRFLPGARSPPEPDVNQLSSVILEFNERFGATEFRDQDRVTQFLFEELPEKIGENRRVQNALRNSDSQNARIEHDRAVDDELLGSWPITLIYTHCTTRQSIQGVAARAAVRCVEASPESEGADHVTVTVQVLFDQPQHEIASLLRDRLTRSAQASLVAAS